MSIGEWLAGGFLALLMLVGLPGVVRLWRGPVDAWLKPQNWWPYSRRAWVRWIKAGPTLYATGLFMILCLPIGIYVSTLAGLILAFLFMAGFVTALCIMFFNRPIYLIPPPLRSKN
jgi:hypothetical protein